MCIFQEIVFDLIKTQQIVVVTGKGGVGKSTISAALALESAREGKRTLVCELNADERISKLLGFKPSGPELTLLEPNLWSIDLNPDQAMREYALMTLKFEKVYNAVFENKTVKNFLKFVPSLQEVVLLGKILFHSRELRPDGTLRFERIIIDGPATGHALTFYSVPQVLIDTVPPGAMANDATWMRDLVVNPHKTAAVLVSLPEDMPVNETLELSRNLQNRVHLTPQVVVLNTFVEERFRETPAISAALAVLVKTHQARAKASRESLEKLKTLGLPVLTLPPIFSEQFGRQAIEELGRCLREGRPR
jgi:anion-transporting  ArsA/GET3 family ATPase